jgi:hypothetical protein
MKGYKGFDKDMKCRDFKFKEGETYEEKTAVLCNSGFHFCEYPLDVFNYYSLVDTNGNLQNIHEVEAIGYISDKETNGDTKRSTTKIKIGAKINILNIGKLSVDYILENVKKNKVKDNTGDRSASTNTGNRSASTNTGNRSASTNTGNRSASTNTGDYSASTNTGNRSVSTNTGDCSASTNTGNRSASTNTGDYSVSTNTGKNGIAVAWGNSGKASGEIGCYIVVAEYDKNNNFKSAKMARVDGKKIKANVFYSLKNGNFVEVSK